MEPLESVPAPVAAIGEVNDRDQRPAQGRDKKEQRKQRFPGGSMGLVQQTQAPYVARR
jgi:hypothetical protein